MPDGARILVVDDDPDILAVLLDLLQDEGYQARTAMNGREALDVLDVWRPDLIILDLMMPVMDGPTFRRRQRELNLAVDIPLLILSAARNMNEITDQLGAGGSLAKPFSLDRLLDLIESLLAGRTSPAPR